MVPLEIEELKTQLEELIEKGYTRLVFHVRSTCLVYAKGLSLRLCIDYSLVNNKYPPPQIKYLSD